MQHKQAIAVEIALKTKVLKTCPIHNELFCDDDVDPSGAFALAVELVTEHRPDVDEFHDDPHALTDLLSATIGATPSCCPVCASLRPGQTPHAEAGIGGEEEASGDPGPGKLKHTGRQLRQERASGLGESCCLAQGFL
jgi:hypothetical protein